MFYTYEKSQEDGRHEVVSVHRTLKGAVRRGRALLRDYRRYYGPDAGTDVFIVKHAGKVHRGDVVSPRSDAVLHIMDLDEAIPTLHYLQKMK